MATPFATVVYETPLPGQTTLRPGDVLCLSGGVRYIVDWVNATRAHCVTLDVCKKTVTTRFGDSFEISTGRETSVCCNIERGEVLERRGAQGLKEALTAKASRRAGFGNNTEANNKKGNNNMTKTTTTKRPARGGLAADKAEMDKAEMEKARDKAKTETKTKPTKAKKDSTKTKDEAPRSKGALGQWLGFSVASVLQRLGVEGVTVKHAEAIAKANKQTPALATIAGNVRAGRNGKAKSPAALTAEQIKTMLASAPAPEGKKEEAKEPAKAS